MLTLPKTKTIELSALTSAIQKVVPELEGMSDHGTTLDIRRLTGDFTPDEEKLISQEIASHDATAIRDEKSAEQQANELELKINAVESLTLTQVDSVIDGISTIADLKVFLKKLVRYLIAIRG